MKKDSVVLDNEIQGTEAVEELILDDKSVTVEDEPEQIVEEPELIEPDKFVIQLGEVWFKTWNPFTTSKDKSEALVLNSDWARHYKSVIPMHFRIPAEIVQI